MIATRDMGTDIAACLRALEPQCRLRTEVLVVDGSCDGTGDLIERRFPWVSLTRDPTGAGVAELRATGLAKARGEIIAFSDAYGQVCANWVDRLIAAPWSRFATVGGVVAPDSCRNLSDWAAFFCEYGAPLTVATTWSGDDSTGQ